MESRYPVVFGGQFVGLLVLVVLLTFTSGYPLDADGNDQEPTYLLGVKYDEYPMIVPKKRAAMLIDRLMVALQKAIDEEEEEEAAREHQLRTKNMLLKPEDAKTQNCTKMHILLQVVAKLFVIITLVSVGLARPQHFGETNQVGDKDQETAVNTNMMAPGQLNDRELELIAQSLFQSQQPHALFPDWRENLIRVPVQMKRQSKLACYFNPVSCFKK